MKKTLLILLFLMTSVANAETDVAPKSTTVIAPVVGASPKEVKGVILNEATSLMSGQSEKLPRIADGLRQKKVVFAWFSVYIAQVFSAKVKPDFKSIPAFKQSLLNGLPVVVTMTFVRDVDIGKITDGFKDVFDKNKINYLKPPFSEALAAVQKAGDVKDRGGYRFEFDRKEQKESVVVLKDGKEVYSLKEQSPGIISQFLDLWFGAAPDTGLEQMQEQILESQKK